MTRLDPGSRLVAAALAALAGFVDAVGFVASGGFFVSFMSGNSTRLGIGIATDRHAAATAATLVLCFVVGVVIASLIRGDRPDTGWRVTLLTGATLIAAAALHPHLPVPVVLAMVAFAMGAENVVFAGQGPVVALTYMTGTLVRVGQGIADLLAGRARWNWVPFVAMWAAMITGGALGAWSVLAFGLDALWGAGALALAATAYLYVRPPAAS